MSRTLKTENGDLFVNESNGRVQYIEGIEKLSQDVAWSLMVTYDPERDFGQELDQVLTGNRRIQFLSIINAAFIRERVTAAIERLQALQQQYPEHLSPYEAIERIQDIKVYPIDETGYVFEVDVRPKAGPDKNPRAFEIRLSHQLPG